MKFKRSLSVRLTAGFMAMLLAGLFVGVMIRPIRTALASGIAPGAYNLIQDEAVSLFKRSTVNFTGGGVGCSDDVVNNRTNCDIPGTGVLFSSVTNAGPNNTAAETTLIGTIGQGSTTIPANTFGNGSVFEARAQGFFSLPATADALTLKMKCGSTVLASTTFTPAAGVLTNATFRFWLMITGRGTGAAGSFITNGQVDFSTGITTTGQAILNTSTVAFDFTTACVFDITAQWGAGQVGELMTATNAAAWQPGAAAGGSSSSGSSPNIATIVRPVPGDFVWINQGTATLSTLGGGLNITGDATGGTNVRAQVANAPAAPWSCTMNVSPMLKTGNARAGLVLNETGTGKLASWGAGGGNPAVIIIDVWSSPTSFSGTRFSIGTTVPMFSNGGWFRAAFDGTDMIYSLSPDGVNFSIYFQEVATNEFTVGPDQCGIFFDSEGTGGQPPLSVTLLSFTF